MYAVVASGGKQYRAAPGGFVDVDRLPVEVGDPVTLEQVLLIVDGDEIAVGQPTVAGAVVRATVLAQRRHRKVTFFHYVQKKRERKKRGQRQHYTRLQIEQIQVGSGE